MDHIDICKAWARPLLWMHMSADHSVNGHTQHCFRWCMISAVRLSEIHHVLASTPSYVCKLYCGHSALSRCEAGGNDKYLLWQLSEYCYYNVNNQLLTPQCALSTTRATIHS